MRKEDQINLVLTQIQVAKNRLELALLTSKPDIFLLCHFKHQILTVYNSLKTNN